MKLYLRFILEFWNLFDRKKTGPFCLSAADVYDHYDNNCYNFLLIMQIKYKHENILLAVGGCGGVVNVTTSPVPFLSPRAEKMDSLNSFEPFYDDTIPYNTNCR